MIAYITGIAGFLGSNVATQLLGRGWTVVGCDNMLTGKPENIPKGSVFFRDDIRSFEKVPDKIDLMIHTAAIARAAWPSEDEIHQVNIDGTRKVMEAAQVRGAKIVHCSSCVAAMPDINAYAYTKRQSEDEAIAAGAVALRYSNIYGKGQSEDGPEPNVLASWLRQKKNGDRLRIDGQGFQTRDFIHVTDAARATVEAGLSDVQPGWYDICTGVQTPIIDVAFKFSNRMIYGGRRAGDPDSIPQDPEPAELAFDFRAVLSIREGLKEVLE